MRITEMPQHACWGCWQAEAWPPSRVSGSCPPPGSHPTGVAPKSPLTRTSPSGLPPLCFHSLATCRSLSECALSDNRGSTGRQQTPRRNVFETSTGTLSCLRGRACGRAQMSGALTARRQVWAPIISLVMESPW